MTAYSSTNTSNNAWTFNNCGGRLWSSGFELNDNRDTASGQAEWIAGTGFGSGGNTISTTTVRSGAYAGRTNPSAASNQWVHQFVNGASNSQFYFRTYVNIATAPDNAANVPSYVMEFWNGQANARLSIRMGETSTADARKLRVYNSAGTAQGSWSPAISAGCPVMARIAWWVRSYSARIVAKARLASCRSGTSSE